MKETENKPEEQLEKKNKPAQPESEEWYTQALEELDEFIESQGIYIRQQNYVTFGICKAV